MLAAHELGARQRSAMIQRSAQLAPGLLAAAQGAARSCRLAERSLCDACQLARQLAQWQAWCAARPRLLQALGLCRGTALHWHSHPVGSAQGCAGCCLFAVAAGLPTGACQAHI